ncbi:hypothetical protein [Paenibacillus ginsengarvi]|uniref:DUF4179 domain-containing protein n=1 Tax=Paenibacillus ginsengarvi TaxID=400777 RepID=A0A3B0CKS5_9BACL|nr:hypothetical protein [Paenibacillus ginsengarvi]RKN85441.1 hypothetical protein D7M11_07035 [Paenibacillus ginsengarvi]
MNETEKWDRLLRQSLASEAEAEPGLNQTLIDTYKRTNRVKRKSRSRLSLGLLAAVIALVMSVTAYAATKLFSSGQVAEHLGERILAEAFASHNAIEINRTIASGNYRFTLHGIVSGSGLKEWNREAHGIAPDRTYAVVSIAKKDGSRMPATSDPEYGKDPFFVSPLVKGLKPWQVNIVTMKGGYSEVVVDGIMYRLIECDGVEMFADRGVYLAISSGDAFYNNAAFAYDESTGEISARTDYAGTSILFELPLDQSKADRAKADAYLRELLQEPSAARASEPASAPQQAEAELARHLEQLKSKVAGGTLIPESVKAVTHDELGRINYEYDGWTVKLAPILLFTEGQTGFSDAVQFSEADGRYKALLFSRDAEGVITGRVIDLN